jgi:surface antigen
MKSLHADQQNAIVVAASIESVGDVQPWRVKHTLPVENGHGEVRVLREFNSALATCREFAFSVIDGEKPDAKEDWFIASACKQQDGWRWASAEPAVSRWGNLQ